jgi:cobalt-zinc-cadmium efflux system outer membrane protein
MTARLAIIVVIGCVACGAAASAQTGSPRQAERLGNRYLDPVGGLEIDRAVAQALEQSPSLRAARTEIDAAQGMREQAGLHPNPMFSFSQQNEPGGTDSQTRVEVVWPLDLFRKTGRVDAAEREIDATRHAVADRERLLAADVRTQYGEAAAAIRTLSVLDDLFDALSRQHELVTARVEQGATPPLERDMLRVELQRVQSERLLQSGVVERAMIELRRILGLTADTPLRLRDTLEQLVERTAVALPPQAASAAAPAGAAQERPDVEAVKARVLVADAQIARADREGRIDMNLFGMYMRTDAAFPQRAFGTTGGLEPIRGLFHYVAAGVTVNLPLRDRKQGEMAAAQAKRAGAAAELDAARLTAQAEIAAARVRLDRARQAVSIYSSETRALAKQNLSVVAQTYELGRATVFDVLAEERRYLDVERAYTNALREAFEARQALARALGEVR